MKLLILSSPRTGSNWLCEALSQTGQLGNVEGFFVGYGDGIKSKFRGYASDYFTNNASANGDLAVKVMWDYLDHIIQHAGYTDYNWFMSQFTHVLHLSRHDIIAQAVSWHVALASGDWTSKDAQKQGRPGYDLDKLRYFVEVIEAYNTRTETYIDLRPDLPSMSMSYEIMTQLGIGETCRAILRFCELPETVENVAPTLQRQEDAIKSDYRKRFNDDVTTHLRTTYA